MTETGPFVMGMTGPDRGMLYALAAGTGLRSEELRTLTPERFDFGADPPTVTVRAGYAKNGHEAIQPLPAALADRLAPWIATKPPGRPVFEGITKTTAEMQFAGVWRFLSGSVEYRRWELNPHGRFRPEDFKSSASAIPPRRLLTRMINRQMRAGGAGSPSALVRFVVDRTGRGGFQSATSWHLAAETEAFLALDQSTWQVIGLQQTRAWLIGHRPKRRQDGRFQLDTWLDYPMSPLQGVEAASMSGDKLRIPHARVLESQNS